MATIKTQEKTVVGINERVKCTYEIRNFLIFTWWAKVKTESLGKDLVIDTMEKYDKVYINDTEVITK